MSLSFEPLYLNGQLGVSMTTVGLILGLATLTGLPAQIAGGAAADRYGRLPVLVLAIIASIVLWEGLAFSQQLWQVVFVIFFEGAFGWAMFLIASNAMVADLVAPDRRAEGFGIIRVAMSAGMIVGPLVAGLLLRLDPTFGLQFVASGAACAIFLGMVLLFFKETRPARVTDTDERSRAGGYRIVLRDRAFVLFCAVSLLPLYGYGQLWSTLPVMLHDTLSLSPRMWGFLLALNALTAAVLQYPALRRLRGVDSMLLMSLGSALMAVGLGGATLASTVWMSAVFMVVISLGAILVLPVASTIVSHMAPVELRGRYMGVWTLVFQAGYALGPLFGGLAIDRLGAHGAGLVIMAAGLLAAPLFVLMRAEPRRGSANVDESAPPARGEAGGAAPIPWQPPVND